MQITINHVKPEAHTENERARDAQTCTQVTSSKSVCAKTQLHVQVPSQKPSEGQASQLDSTGSAKSSTTLKPINLSFVYVCNGEIEKWSCLALLFTFSHVVDFHDKVLKMSVPFELSISYSLFYWSFSVDAWVYRYNDKTMWSCVLW